MQGLNEVLSGKVWETGPIEASIFDAVQEASFDEMTIEIQAKWIRMLE